MSLLPYRRSSSDPAAPLLIPRKGGGGGGGHGGGGGRGGSTGKGGSGGKSSASHAPSISHVAFSTRSASSYSQGGGKPTTVPSGPFSGRSLGGGTRNEVYGTSHYGSGYPAGLAAGTVAGAGFPFGFWPIYTFPSYHGSDEYGPAANTSRPGGAMSTALIASASAPGQSYHIIGDNNSVSQVLLELESKCHVFNSSVTPYDLTRPNNNLPGPAQIVQYYRASSFALALDSYTGSNDSAAALTLPSSIDQPFLLCLNSTIAAAVPILDAPASNHLSTVTIIWIVLGSIEALLVILVIICCCLSKRPSAPLPTADKRTTKAQAPKASVPVDDLRPRSPLATHSALGLKLAESRSSVASDSTLLVHAGVSNENVAHGAPQRQKEAYTTVRFDNL
ncbi:hypothetical protein AURDEDRAFT_115731 [Auricularia subglabra TFB-10046 SS5]|uniref:Uncharacterized protein n=1 Tax=Auricularia subglabra (strain TFB-10046 / SS5) TaxID=717982 RepID=J0DCW1_AURST|nr:hypothetical protein AURDEDRAFT_115731 [Auricularia subglabra TFB-10046 SS5]